MNKVIFSFVIILFIILSSDFYIHKAPSMGKIVFEKQNNSIIHEETISKGVTFYKEHIKNFNNEKWNDQILNYIILDLSLANKEFNLTCHKSNNTTTGKKTLKDQIIEESNLGKNIVAGINGDFFNVQSGIPVCNDIINKEIFSTSLSIDEEILRPSFCIFDDSSVDISSYHFDGMASFNTKSNFNPLTLKINSVNRIDYLENTINLFNNMINSTGTITLPNEKEDALLILIELEKSFQNSSIYVNSTLKGTIKNIIQDPPNTYKIVDKELVIVAYDEMKDQFKNINVGNSVEIKLNIFKHSVLDPIKNIRHLLTGHEYIVYDSEVPSREYFSKVWNQSSIFSRNYRTSLGITKDNKLILVTVDRNGKFKGMSLPELGNFLISKNVVKAINLDGGGSTQMMIRHQGDFELLTANSPKENRPLSNSLMISNISQNKTNISNIFFKDSNKINMHHPRQFSIKAVDENLNPVALYGNKEINFSSDVGHFDENGVFFPIQNKATGSIFINTPYLSETFQIEIVE